MRIKSILTILTVIGILVFSACSSSTTKNEQKQKIEQTAKVEYTCTMHPEIIRDKPGMCPICGMELVKKQPRKK